MKTAFKKIITSVLILSILLSPSLSSLEKSSAQTEEPFKITCEKEIPVGEAIDATKYLTKALTEDLDFMVIAFLQQEHAVKRIYKLSDGGGSLIDWWGLAEALIPYLAKISKYARYAICANAAVKITKSTIALSGAVNKIYMGFEGVNDFKESYKEIKEVISDAGGVFTQGFLKVQQGVSDIKEWIEDIKGAGKTINDNYKDIEKIKTGYEKITRGGDETIPGLIDLITGIRALNKVILAIRKIDESLGLINGEVQKNEGTGEWKCLEYGWYCSYIGGTLGPYETEAECQEVSTMGTGCACSQPLGEEECEEKCEETYEDKEECKKKCKEKCKEGKKQTGLCLIQAQLGSLMGVLNLIPELRKSLEKIRDGIDGILELSDSLKNFDEAIDELPKICREALPSQLVSALDLGIETKKKIEPIIEGIIEGIDTPLEGIRDLINGAIEVLLTVDEKIAGENALKDVSTAVIAIIKDTRNIIESIREEIPDIPTVNDLFWGVLKGIKEKIKGLFGKEKKDVDKQIDDILDKDKDLCSDDASTSTDVTGDTGNLDNNATSTHSTAEDNKGDLETGNNRLEGIFKLLDTGIENELDILTEYFEEIAIISIFNLETLLDLTGLNQCNCERCFLCNPCIVIEVAGVPVPIPCTSICWGLACPYGQIKIYVNSIGALQTGDWGWAPKNVYYWLNGQKKGRLTYMEEAWEELNDLIYTEENRVWREGEPEELSLGNLTKSEFYLIIKELAGKELEDCFVTTEMFEKGESLKYLFSCENALKEGLIPQTVDCNLDCNPIKDEDCAACYEQWYKTIEGRCYRYPNNFVCCQ